MSKAKPQMNEIEKFQMKGGVTFTFLFLAL